MPSPLEGFVQRRAATSSLREMQLEFARALFAAGPGGAHRAPQIRADGVSPVQRLGFYRTNVLGNYLDALRASFPAVERLVGNGYFRHLAQRYIAAHPSRSGDLNRYGDAFAGFLASLPVSERLPYVADVARLEWALEESFSEGEHAPLAIERLAQVPAEDVERLTFSLHPACRLLRSPYPVRRIWRLAQADREADEKVELDMGGEDLLVRRQGFELVIDGLAPGDYELLCAIAAHATLAHAHTSALAACAKFDIAACLQRHVGAGTLVDFSLAA
jgi:hypothetical protein